MGNLPFDEGEIYLEFSEGIPTADYRVFDVTGRIFQEGSLHQKHRKINVSRIKTETYVISLQFNKGVKTVLVIMYGL
jgi:hypothetical protein